MSPVLIMVLVLPISLFASVMWVMQRGLRNAKRRNGLTVVWRDRGWMFAKRSTRAGCGLGTKRVSFLI